MNKFTFVTLFDSLIKNYFDSSILSRAIENELIKIDFVNPRDYTKDKHLKVDSPQAGGGAGMLLKPQPLYDALQDIRKETPEAHFIFVTPAGKPFRQLDAKRLAKKKNIVLISGRYEGFDERVVELCADELFSVGDFILTGGELPSLCICDSICRNIPKVLGNSHSLEGESFENMLLEAPSFTKPNVFVNKSIIKEYTKGNHSKIQLLKNRLSRFKTNYFRPDLYKKVKNTRKNDEK